MYLSVVIFLVCMWMLAVLLCAFKVDLPSIALCDFNMGSLSSLPLALFLPANIDAEHAEPRIHLFWFRLRWAGTHLDPVFSLKIISHLLNESHEVDLGRKERIKKGCYSRLKASKWTLDGDSWFQSSHQLSAAWLTASLQAAAVMNGRLSAQQLQK